MKISQSIFLLLVLSLPIFSPATSFAAYRNNQDLDLAISLFDKNAYELAIEQLDKIILKNEEVDNKRQVFFYLAESYKNLNNLERAGHYYHQVLTATGYGYMDSALFELGQIAYSQQDYAAAIQHFEMLTRRYIYSKFNTYARYWTAESYYKLGRLEEARQLYTQLLQESPGFEYNDYVRYSLARISIQQANFPVAKKLLQQLLQTPRITMKESVYYFLASVDFKSGDLTQAREHLEKLKQEYPGGKYENEANLLLAESDYEKNAYAKAIERYSLLLPESRYKEQALQGRAWSFFLLEKYNEALTDLDVLSRITADPVRRGKVMLLEAQSYYHLKQYANTDKLLLEATSTANERGLAEKINLMQIASSYQQARWSDVVQYSSDYLLRYSGPPPNDQVLFQRGIAFYKLAKYSQAMNTFQSLTAGEYKQKSGFFMADIYYRSNDYPNAKKYYKDIVDNYPSHNYREQSLYNLAWCAYQTATYKESALYFGNFFTRYRNNPLAEKALYLKAESQLNLYAYNDALQTLSDFIKTYPRSDMREIAAYYQAFTLYKLEKLYDAINYFEPFIKTAQDKVLLEKALYWEASAYFRLRIWDKARLLFAQLAERKSEPVPQVEIYQKLGDACYNSKDYQAALEYYSTGLTLAKDVDWAKQLHSSMIYALLKLDRLEEARQEADKFLSLYGDRAAIETLLNQITAKEKMKGKDAP